jgi:splicing factor 3B subunit 1
MSDGKHSSPAKARRAETDEAIAEIRRLQQERASTRANPTKQSLTDNADTELYGNGTVDKYAGYNMSIAVNEDDDMDDADGEDQSRRLVGQYTATTEQMNEYANGEGDILVDREKQAQIASRESDYQKRRFNRQLSPDGQS